MLVSMSPGGQVNALQGAPQHADVQRHASSLEARQLLGG